MLARLRQVSDVAATELLAGFKQFRPCCIVNGSIDTAAAEKRRVRSVYHAIDIEFGDVSEHSL